MAVPTSASMVYSRYANDVDLIMCGEGDSPLHRTAKAVHGWGTMRQAAKYLIRVTHDDILIDPETMLKVLHEACAQNAGYAISPNILEGAGVEVIETENLLYAARNHKEPVEHISYFVKGEGLPNPKCITVEPRETIKRPYRLTLDYPEDATVLEAVLQRLGALATNDEICAFLDQNAYLLRHNAIPKFSVYMCVKDAAPWVKDAIMSIPANAELVIVEDKSTDSSLLEIIHATTMRPQVKLIVNEENLGLASSSNIALKHCRGRYVMRVDADDMLMPWTIEKMFEEMEKTNAAIVYANYAEINEIGTILTENVDATISHHAGCALMDAKLINQLRFKDGLRHWDSLELYMRVKDRFPIAYVNGPVWFYRRHANSMSVNDLEERTRVKKEILTS